MVRLREDQWKIIFNNLAEYGVSDYNDSDWVEVVWLDPGDGSEGEWCLCNGTEVFEDGFEDAEVAQNRLRYLEILLL